MSAATASILGVPMDLTESFRPGTGEAPGRIREVAESLEDYSPVLDVDLAERAIEDRGDLVLTGLSVDQALDAIDGAATPLFQRGLVMSYGGEHTATLGLVRAARRAFPDLAILQLDAHTDTRTDYEGARVTHATWVYVAGGEMGFDSIAQLGLRSGTRAEFQLGARCLQSSSDLVLTDTTWKVLRSRPVYVTIDIDVLDPSVAPGTGCPEPGGATYREVAALLYSLRELRVVGADVMEVLPRCDVADVTSITAAKLGREMLCMWAPAR